MVPAFRTKLAHERSPLGSSIPISYCKETSMRAFNRALLMVGTCAALLLTATASRAQVCGDADGNGNVSVTDGVQALRAAAALSTTCTAGVCDIDGNGSISVTDAVNIIRKAAGLQVVEACQLVNQQVEELV